MNIYLKFILSLAIPLIIGGIGGFFTTEAITEWYITLEKPFFNPPNWIFGPVWTLLYAMMGIAFFLIWKQGFGMNTNKIIGIYSIQLFFNLMWSIVFFELESPGGALIIIAILWGLILKNILVFYKESKIAGYILIPYIMWVSFASLLNAAIFYLN